MTTLKLYNENSWKFENDIKSRKLNKLTIIQMTIAIIKKKT